MNEKDNSINHEKIVDAAVEWWVQKVTGNYPHSNGDDSFQSVASCIMADIGRKHVSEKQVFAFKEVLRGILTQRIAMGEERIILSCDYGPDKDLGFAADASGIGYLNFPFKTWMKITKTNVEVSDGYAQPLKEIFSVGGVMQ